jgi:hypothetical protein
MVLRGIFMEILAHLPSWFTEIPAQAQHPLITKPWLWHGGFLTSRKHCEKWNVALSQKRYICHNFITYWDIGEIIRKEKS